MQFTTTKRKRCTCSRCGKEGHNANNKLFHPESIPKAKVGSDRVNAKSAAQQPTRNCGEIDDEEEPPDMVSDSEDEDSDNDSIPGLEIILSRSGAMKCYFGKRILKPMILLQ